jgi:hypothetical protein
VGENRSEFKVLVGKSEAKIPLGRSRRGWENNIKKDLSSEDGRV